MKPPQDSAEGPIIGCVVIGRNEGERLGDSLRSALSQTPRVIYADSGSTDGSRDIAETLDVMMVVLDAGTPMTAARGRNAGFHALQQHYPECEFVQFLDGDCVLMPGWIKQAGDSLRSNPRVAVVCGRRFETAPGASFYNQLMDQEWDTPIGQALSCGGDSLVRIAALDQISGFRSELMAGEEPEMCARLRAAGWEIWRLDALMSEHDANIHRLKQWWQRAKRSGFGYAQVWQATRPLPVRLYGRELLRAWFWAILLPLLILSITLATNVAWLLLLLPLAYAAQVARIAARSGLDSRRSWQSALLTVLSKFAEAIGSVAYFASGSAHRAYDYKPVSKTGKLETP